MDKKKALQKSLKGLCCRILSGYLIRMIIQYSNIARSEWCVWASYNSNTSCVCASSSPYVWNTLESFLSCFYYLASRVLYLESCVLCLASPPIQEHKKTPRVLRRGSFGYFVIRMKYYQTLPLPEDIQQHIICLN